MPRFLSPLILLVLLLSGCAPSGLSHPVDAPSPSRFITHYQSGLNAPRDKALYHFARASMLRSEGDVEAVSEALTLAVKADPDTPELKLYLAQVELEREQPERAMELLEEIFREAVDPLEAHRLAAQILLEQGDAEAAIVHLRKVVESRPGDESAALQLAQALAISGDVAGGIEILRTFATIHPESVRSRYALARFYRRLDLRLSAEQAYRDLLRLHPAFVPAYIELGEMYEEGGTSAHLLKALSLYLDGLSRLPADPALRQLAARTLIRLERLPEALTHLDALLAVDPGNHDALRRKGLVHLELEQWQAAATAFERLLPLAADRGPVHYYLGLALERLDDVPGAVKEFRQVPESSELFGDARLHAAYLFQGMQREPEAIRMLEPAVSAGKAGVDGVLYLGALYAEIGDFARALQVYQRAENDFPGNTRILFRSGALLDRMGMRDQAEQTLRRLLEADPEHAEGLNFLAYLFAEENRNLDEALSMARKAAQLKEAGHIYDTLGWVLFRLGRYEEALTWLERAERLLPGDPVILEHLGDTFRALGRLGPARDAYRKVLELDGSKSEVRQKLQEVGG